MSINWYENQYLIPYIDIAVLKLLSNEERIKLQDILSEIPNVRYLNIRLKGGIKNTLKFIKNSSKENAINLLQTYRTLFTIEENIANMLIESINEYYKESTHPVFSKPLTDLVLILYYLINKNNPMFTEQEINIKGLGQTYIISIMLRYLFNLNVLPKKFLENFKKIGTSNEYKYPIYVDSKDGDSVNEKLVPNLWVKGRIQPFGAGAFSLRTVEIEYSIVKSILYVTDILENIRVNLARGNKSNDTYETMKIQQKQMEVLQGKLSYDIENDIKKRDLVYKRYPSILNINKETKINGVIVYPETIKFLNELEELKGKSNEEKTTIFINHYTENYKQVLSLGDVNYVKDIGKEVVMNLEEITHSIPKKRISNDDYSIEVTQRNNLRMMSKIPNDKEERIAMQNLVIRENDINQVIEQIKMDEENDTVIMDEESDTVIMEDNEREENPSLSEKPYLMIENEKMIPVEESEIINGMSSESEIVIRKKEVGYNFLEGVEKEMKRINDNRGKLVFKKLSDEKMIIEEKQKKIIFRNTKMNKSSVKTPTSIIFKNIKPMDEVRGNENQNRIVFRNIEREVRREETRKVQIVFKKLNLNELK